MELSALGWNQETLYSSMVAIFTLIQVGLFGHQFWVVCRKKQARSIAPEIYLYQIFLCMMQVQFSSLAPEFSFLLFSAGMLRIAVLVPFAWVLFQYRVKTRLQRGMIIACLLWPEMSWIVHHFWYEHFVRDFFVAALTATVVPLIIQIRKLSQATSPGEGTFGVPLVALISTMCWALYYFSFGIASLMWVALLLCCLQALWVGLWIRAWRIRKETQLLIQENFSYGSVQDLQELGSGR